MIYFKRVADRNTGRGHIPFTAPIDYDVGGLGLDAWQGQLTCHGQCIAVTGVMKTREAVLEVLDALIDYIDNHVEYLIENFDAADDILNMQEVCNDKCAKK